MIQTALLGYPRIGAGRELKRALERYWSSQIDERALHEEAAQIRAHHWKMMHDAGIRASAGGVSLPVYFAMARGRQEAGVDVPALEMTKWFDTNYHYIVPEVEPRMRFQLSSTRVIDHFVEAKSLGIMTRPVLLGPVTFLSLAKAADEFQAQAAKEPLAVNPPRLWGGAEKARVPGCGVGTDGRAHPHHRP